MNFYKIVHLVFGEYKLKTDKKSFPRLANLLSYQKLGFWGVTHTENDITFSVSVFTADKIINQALSAHIPIKIISKKGLPFVFSKYRRRYGLIFGMAFGLFLLFYAQLFVWKIEISGNINVSVAEIEQALADCNISVGGFIPAINTGSAENKLLLNHNILSSAAIGIRGNHVIVSVLERIPTPSIVDKNGYYNVIAAYDGVILDIDAAEGFPEVNVGDVVCKGQLLINSFIEGKYGSVRPTHARGMVYAAVKQELKIEIPLNRTVKNYSGKTQTKTFYSLLGKKIPLFIEEPTDYAYFDAFSVTDNIKLFGFIDIPLRKTKSTYSQYSLKQVRITPDTAKKYAETELNHRLKEYNGQVLECTTRFVTDEIKGVCTLYANATLKLDIAKETELKITPQG